MTIPHDAYLYAGYVCLGLAGAFGALLGRDLARWWVNR